jgi:probable HAF family extracellular repeat protein
MKNHAKSHAKNHAFSRAIAGCLLTLLGAAISGCGGGGDDALASSASAQDAATFGPDVSALAVSRNPAVPVFSVVDLGTLGGPTSAAYAINDLGQVTGTAALDASTSHAFLYSFGRMRDLGALAQGSSSSGSGINNFGQVTGASEVSATVSHAFLYSWGAMHDLHYAGADTSAGVDVNNAGRVLINTFKQLGPETENVLHSAYLYSNGSFDPIPRSSQGSANTCSDTEIIAAALNNSGQVTGFAAPGADSSCAFLYGNGVFQPLGLSISFGTAINDSGRVAGYTFSPVNILRLDSSGFSYDHGQLAGVGTNQASVTPYGINNAGQVVGTAANGHAFLWTGGTLYDLNGLLDSSGASWTLMTAYAINNSAQIVGVGLVGGQNHAFLLTLTRRGDHVGRWSGIEGRRDRAKLVDPLCRMKRADEWFPKCRSN